MPSVVNYLHQPYSPPVVGSELVTPPRIENVPAPTLATPPVDNTFNQVNEPSTSLYAASEPSFTITPTTPIAVKPQTALASSPTYEGSSYDSSLETPSVEMSQTYNTFPYNSTTIVPEIHSLRRPVFRFNRSIRLITATTLSFIVVVGLGSIVSTNLASRSTNSNNSGKQSSYPNQFAVGDLSLQGIQPTDTTQISSLNELTVNGQLQVNSTLSVASLSTLNGGVVITGPTDINTTGTDVTNIGNSKSAVNLNGNVTTNSNLAVQGGVLAIGGGGANGRLIFQSATSSFTTSIQSADQANYLTIIIPADNVATDTICLSALANCLAAGNPSGDLTGTYPNPTIAKLQSKTLTISVSPVTGSLLQYNGSSIVDGG